jgi:hypothetical protein
VKKSILKVLTGSETLECETTLVDYPQSDGSVVQWPLFVPQGDGVYQSSMPWTPLVSGKALATESVRADAIMQNTGVSLAEAQAAAAAETQQLVEQSKCYAPANYTALFNSAVAPAVSPSLENQGICGDVVNGYSSVGLPPQYYAPAYTGMPPIPTDGARFSGSAGGGNPLCTFPLSTTLFLTGYSSTECWELQAVIAVQAIPSYIVDTCRAPLKAMLCSSIFLPTEEKSLCFLSEGCDEAKPGLNLTLPKFVSRDTCLDAVRSCTELFELQEARGTPFSCEDTIQVTDCGYAAEFWSCTSPLNGLPQYPEISQDVIFGGGDIEFDPSSYLVRYLGGYSLFPAFATLGITTVAPTTEASFLNPAACPEPLLVVMDPNADTLAPYTVCQFQCDLPFYSEKEYQSLDIALIICASLGLFGSGSVLATWLIFKEKRKQRIVL